MIKRRLRKSKITEKYIKKFQKIYAVYAEKNENGIVYKYKSFPYSGLSTDNGTPLVWVAFDKYFIVCQAFFSLPTYPICYTTCESDATRIVLAMNLGGENK